jgi:hypothetical protein
MNATTTATITRNLRTYVAPVAYTTLLFAAVLAYGPDAWTWLVDGFTNLPAHLGHLFGLGQGCWDEIKTGLPTEHLCGALAHAPANAVNFTAYPAN